MDHVYEQRRNTKKGERKAIYFSTFIGPFLILNKEPCIFILHSAGPIMWLVLMMVKEIYVLDTVVDGEWSE